MGWGGKTDIIRFTWTVLALLCLGFLTDDLFMLYFPAVSFEEELLSLQSGHTGDMCLTGLAAQGLYSSQLKDRHCLPAVNIRANLFSHIFPPSWQGSFQPQTDNLQTKVCAKPCLTGRRPLCTIRYHNTRPEL